VDIHLTVQHLHITLAGDCDPFAAINLRLDKIMNVLTDLQAAVAAEDTVIDSAITLLQGLSAALTAAGTDPVALAALNADITAKTASLSAAITANTPAAPAAPTAA
jgi:hypothetical protein